MPPAARGFFEKPPLDPEKLLIRGDNMLVASIDLMNGKAVQLVEGKEKILERENPEQLAVEFDRFGEIAVIDLDAALCKGNNKELIKKMCRQARCRVGGGIRSVEQAKELVSFGAERIIIGSKAFEGKRVNVEFLESLAKTIGKERLMVAVDARNNEIVTDGWRQHTGLDLFETAKLLQPIVSELLYTCVEREGRMQGINMETTRHLREIFSKTITVAGGIQSLEEIERLTTLGVDVQLGMSIYTGKIKMDEGFINSLNWKTLLIPVITKDCNEQILMMAYTDKEALKKTFETGNMWYYSRSRQGLWMKGETSGNVQKLIRFTTDCDRDTLIAEIEQTNVACHLEKYSCFGAKKFTLNELYSVIGKRFKNPSQRSYTATLDDKLVRKKIMEEAQEVIEAETHDAIIWEAADLLYFLTVLLQKEDIALDDVLWELNRRRYVKNENNKI
jgi:phosphoribosyl-AMP cyclohydrolase / phosphoribosyl-ATP pyrophosphohydrolase